MGGSVVSVVEGSVAVNQPGTDVVLSPGEQAASNPALASTVADAISWSPEADEYLELLGSFVKIERQLAEMSPGELRTSSALLSYLPAGAFVYGAVPTSAARSARPWSWRSGRHPRTPRSGLGGAPRRTAVETDRRPRAVGELAARGRDRLLSGSAGTRWRGADGNGPRAARPACGAGGRPGWLFVGTGEPAPPYSVSKT